MLKIRVLAVVFVIFCNLIASLYLFSNGFLIRRTALNHTNNHTASNLRKCSKTIVLFVDALRFDFVFSNGLYFGLPAIEHLLENEPKNSRLYKFIADPPTTTMQRIKAIMSGTLPTFIDAGANFNSYLIDDDNLIRQSHLNNKSVIIFGDDTWLSLFPNEHIFSHKTFPSFNIKDLDTNDMEVDKELRRLFNAKNKDWGMVIGHYLGLDHCGHTFGPKNAMIKRKLADISNSIKYVADSIDNDTLLVVFGDHGMTEVGDHGGDSKLEVESALFFYSKQTLFEHYDKSYEKVRQIDLTPTLALALGIPIPFSNLGIPILSFFNSKKLEVLSANLDQIRQFTQTYNQIETLFDETKLLEHDLPNHQTTINDLLVAKKYQDLKLIQEKFRAKWSTFSIKDCLLGILAFSLNILIILIIILNLNLNIESNILFLSSIFMQIASILSFLFCVLFLVVGKSLANFLWFFVLVFNLAIIKNLIGFEFIKHFCVKSVSSFSIRLEYYVYVLTLLVPFSNSFVVNEAVSYRYFLATLFYIQIYYKLRKLKFFYWKKVLAYVIYLLLVRCSFLFQTCREENMHKCTQYPFSIQLSKTSLDTSGYLAFIFVNISAIAFIVHKLNNQHDKKLNALFFLQLALLTIYNLLEFWLNNIETAKSYEKDFISQLRTANVYLARVFYLIFFLDLFIAFKSKSFRQREEFVANLSISLGLLTSLILNENKLSIWILIFILNSYSKQENLLQIKKEAKNSHESIDPVVLLFLLQHYYFYATGHETTFTHIKWESGFHGMHGDTSVSFVQLIMGLLIMTNTFCSTIVVLLFVPNNYDSCSRKEKHENLLKSVLKMTLLNSTKVFCTVVSVYLLRRHLMVWKIFAPRFVFDSINLVIGFFFLILYSILY